LQIAYVSELGIPVILENSHLSDVGETVRSIKWWC